MHILPVMSFIDSGMTGFLGNRQVIVPKPIAGLESGQLKISSDVKSTYWLQRPSSTMNKIKEHYNDYTGGNDLQLST